MKTLKLVTLTLCLMFVYGASQAMQQDSKSEKLTTNYTMQTYVNAIHYGKLKGLSEVIDANAQFTMKRGDKVISNTKEEILKELKRLENVEQNCEIVQTVVSNLPSQMIVKVDMKYTAFTRINYVTLSESNAGWKISRVSSAFE